MKCIKSIKTGKIRRVKDKEAEEAVKSGYFAYTNKEEWKALRPSKNKSKKESESDTATAVAGEEINKKRKRRRQQKKSK